MSAATLCLVNQQRAAAALAPLVDNAALDVAAESHSIDMVANDYFDHVTSTGVDVLHQVLDVAFAAVSDVVDVAQNIAAGAAGDATPAATVADWMSSPPHRANILDPGLRESGVGVVPALPAVLGISGPGATYTQTFATSG
ncbi:MAG TPA: CAP domain-containing protein [Solirubrobacteraceae bacterium]|nr:CAP domain-containing protein [Solirubrobacteraceae bacterium]